MYSCNRKLFVNASVKQMSLLSLINIEAKANCEGCGSGEDGGEGDVDYRNGYWHQYQCETYHEFYSICECDRVDYSAMTCSNIGERTRDCK